jgi:hypothetical protein
MADQVLVTVHIRGESDRGRFAQVSADEAERMGLKPMNVENQDSTHGVHNLGFEDLTSYLVPPETPQKSKK